MHELALADAVVKAAIRAANDSGLERLDQIVVTIGELQTIESELFRYSLNAVLPDDPRVAGVEFVIEQEPAQFICRACGQEFGRPELEAGGNTEAVEAIHLIPELAHVYVRCPSCGSPDFEIVAGRGVTVLRIEGTAADAAE